MSLIFTPAHDQSRPHGSTAYRVYHHRHGYLGLVGNRHETRPTAGALTRHTSWWATRHDEPSQTGRTREDFPTRDAAASWMVASMSAHNHQVDSPDDRFTAHLIAIAHEQGHAASWTAASHATYLRLNTMLTNRYTLTTPVAIWREIIQMITWLDATHPKTDEI